MGWTGRYIASAVAMAVTAGVLVACNRPDRHLAAAAATPVRPSHSRQPAAGPGHPLPAHTAVAVDGVVIRRGGKPVAVRMGHPVRLDVTVTPMAGTRITDLYLGMAGPGSWGDRNGAPIGDYTVLLRTRKSFDASRHFTVTWVPAEHDRGRVYLSVFYLVTDSVHLQLNEMAPVGFSVSATAVD